MLDTYANSSGQIRLGTLLMDLDALSGVVAYRHTGEGVTTVTAAVDRITIKNPLKEICDLDLSGQVTFATGRSSMEISLQIAKASTTDTTAVREEDVFMTCAFTMVSLDPVTKKPVNVAPLKLENDAERQLYARGEENYRSKKALKSSAITQKPPDAQEAALLHKMWTDSLSYHDAHNPTQKPRNITYMNNATIYSAQIMQPQYRNRHHFMIFGGYLLKQTFELAFTCAAAFSHAKPSFLNLDPSTFENPVPVGSVLYLSAGVTFTEPDVTTGGTRIQVIVTTKVRNVEHQDRKSTGTFFYTFHVDNDVQILPQTYSEFMRWVDGRRRAQRLAASLQANLDAGNTRDSIGTAPSERATE
jgi:acyl-coenzyme A thioesterase 9